MTHVLSQAPPRTRRWRQFVLLTGADGQRPTGERQTLKDYLLNGPDLGELDLTRDQSPMREVTW